MDSGRSSPDPSSEQNCRKDSDGSPRNSRPEEEEDLNTFPEGGREAWLCVLGAFFLLMASYGFMVSIGTIQDYWLTHQLAGWSPRDVGWIPSCFVYLGLALGVLVGPLFDRYGSGLILPVGSALYTASIFALAESSRYWHFMLSLGVLGGISTAMITTSALTAVSHWFDKRRGFATGVALLGNSVGGTIIPLILQTMFPEYGWKWTIRITGFTFFAMLLVGSILTKGRLVPCSRNPVEDVEKQSSKKPTPSFLPLYPFLNPAFVYATLTLFALEFVLFGTLGILPTYATLQTTYPPATGFYLISLLNAFSCLGRVLPGLIADRVGRFNTLLVMIILNLLVLLTIWLPFGASSLPALFAFAALFGFGSGSWMALMPVCIGQLCPAREFGTHFGASYFVASLATLLSIPVNGELLARVGPKGLVGFDAAVLAGAVVVFAAGRWAALGNRWRWRVKI